MRILSWNVNGYRACTKHGGLDDVFKDKPDFVCLQEIKLSDETALFNLTTMDYFCYPNLSDKKGRNGVAVFTLAEPKNVITHIGYEKFDLDGRFIELEYDEFSIINVYMPHGKRDKSHLSYKLKSYDSLYSYLSNKNCANIIIVGDFNIACEPIDLTYAQKNKKNIMFTKEEREKLLELKNYGFIDTFRKKNRDIVQYSWWTYAYSAREKNIGWRIDYIFIGDGLGEMNYSAFIHDKIFGSDHCPVSIDMSICSSEKMSGLAKQK